MSNSGADSPVWRALDIPLEKLDDLPFGAIVVDENGTIHQYNEYETKLSRLARESVIGKNFFRDVAPCNRRAGVRGSPAGFPAHERSHERIVRVFSFRSYTAPRRSR